MAADLMVRRSLMQCRYHGSWIRRRSLEGGKGGKGSGGGMCKIRENQLVVERGVCVCGQVRICGVGCVCLSHQVYCQIIQYMIDK